MSKRQFWYGKQDKKTDSTKIRDQFMKVISKLELEYSMENIIYPQEIYWVAGPTKSGKTTSACVLLEEIVHQRDALLSMRNLVVGVAQKYKGRTNMDEIVEHLMRTILRKGREGCKKIIVDDFQSTSCARGLPFLYEHLSEIAEKNNRPKPKFKFCVLYANEQNAFKRYKASCPKKLWGSSKFNETRFKALYDKYFIRTNQVSEALKLYFEFNIIDTNGTHENTYNNVLREVRRKKNGQKVKNASLKKLLSSSPTVLRPKRNNKRAGNEKKLGAINDKKEFTKFVRAMYQQDLIESQKVINSFIARDNEKRKSEEKIANDDDRYSNMLLALKAENLRLMNRVENKKVINGFIARDNKEKRKSVVKKANGFAQFKKQKKQQMQKNKKRNNGTKNKSSYAKRKQSKSPKRKQSSSPKRKQSKSPNRKQSSSPKKKQSKSPNREIAKLKKKFENLVKRRKNLE